VPLPFTPDVGKGCRLDGEVSNANRSRGRRVCLSPCVESAGAHRQTLERYEWSLFVVTLATVVGALLIIALAMTVFAGAR
jgi:hypothetical protein